MSSVRLGQPVYEVQELLKAIEREWNELSPEELADKIVDFETRVAQLPENLPAAKKLKKEAARLHFQFVFPITLELENGEFSFAKAIHKLEKEMFDLQSLTPFQELNETQKREVLEIALGGNP
jgi:hypothetical protein